MRFIHTTLAALLLVSAGLGGTSALAHEAGVHDKKAGPIVKEQKDWGIAGEAKPATRTIEVKMLDSMRFSPGKIEVRQGDTVRFVVKNDGKAMHEFVIGTRAENDAHAELMMKHPGMEHDEPWMAHVAPGKTGEIVWTFNRPGDFDFACLIAGHYQAGMVGQIKVAGTDEAAAQPASADMTDGEVTAIDKQAGKMTLRHGEIKNLDMPPMKMVFRVRDAALLDKVKTGDKVRFRAEKEGTAFVVTEVEAAR